tara:strand:+ start:1131 stop:1706 length:576 start_codon:yes stop_codon:yes gene_type:complete
MVNDEQCKALVAYHVANLKKTTGFTFTRWSSWFAKLIGAKTKNRSITLPWKRIYLRDGVFEDPNSGRGALYPSGKLIALLAHEAVHAHQMGGWLYRWFYWTPRYLWSGGPGDGKFLVSQEVEAEATEACWRALLLGHRIVSEKHVSHGMREGGTYQLPKGTDAEDISRQICGLAQELMPSIAATYDDIISG